MKIIKNKKIFIKLLTMLLFSFSIYNGKQQNSIALGGWNAFDSPTWLKVDANSTTGKRIKTSGDIMQWVPLVMAVGLVIWHKDTNLLKIRWKEHFSDDFFNYDRYKNDGITQLALSYGMSMGAYALVNIAFQRGRPRQENDPTSTHHGWFNGGKSFPSGHSTNAYAPAFFIAWRYGWLMATPALIAAAYTGWTRIAVSAHYITDVVAAAGLSCLISWIFTHPYKVGKAQVQVVPANGLGAGVNIQW